MNLSLALLHLFPSKFYFLCRWLWWFYYAYSWSNKNKGANITLAKLTQDLKESQKWCPLALQYAHKILGMLMGSVLQSGFSRILAVQLSNNSLNLIFSSLFTPNFLYSDRVRVEFGYTIPITNRKEIDFTSACYILWKPSID